MPLIECTVIVEGLDKDIETIKSDINKKIPYALERVGAEMQASLVQHLRDDWYMGYTPEVYMRRTDFPSLGKSIMHENTMDIHVRGNSLEFNYTPIGEYPEAPEWHTNDGDSLIESIQTGKLWGNPPPRPFWNNFVDEMANGGIMETFSNAMSPYKIENSSNEINLNSSLLDASANEELPF